MIHYTPEGCYIKLGLNFSNAPGGFRLLWAWYDFGSHRATTYRLRVRWHMAPRILWEAKSWNVIDAHLELHGLDVVSTEVLADLKSVEETLKKRNDLFVYIKP